LPTTALGTDKPIAPIQNRRVRAVSSSHLVGVRLNLVAARLAPHDQPHLRVRGKFEEKSAIDAKPTAKPQKYRLEIPPIAVPLPAG